MLAAHAPAAAALDLFALPSTIPSSSLAGFSERTGKAGLQSNFACCTRCCCCAAAAAARHHPQQQPAQVSPSHRPGPARERHCGAHTWLRCTWRRQSRDLRRFNLYSGGWRGVVVAQARTNCTVRVVASATCKLLCRGCCWRHCGGTNAFTCSAIRLHCQTAPLGVRGMQGPRQVAMHGAFLTTARSEDSCSFIRHRWQCFTCGVSCTVHTKYRRFLKVQELGLPEVQPPRWHCCTTI